MKDSRLKMSGVAQSHYRALSRWDNEGGAGSGGPQQDGITEPRQSEVSPLTEVELVQLRVRVIALENIVIALLAEATDRQLDLVREMASYILPRPGFTQHPFTIHAAAHMVRFIERASCLRRAR
ncbi:MAG: hypothetical protein ABI859_07965 [Pseudomonadota bacterium]